jgi:hypothetical protein
MLTEILPVVLTDDEVRERGIKLAGVLQDIGREEFSKKSFNEGVKGRVDALESEADKLVTVIRAGKEDREVQVEEQKDYKAQEVRTVRLDTGEVIHHRAMTPRELQRPLPIEGGIEKKKSNGKAKAAGPKDATKEARA